MLVTLQRELQEELGVINEDYDITETGIKKVYNNMYTIDPERVGKDTMIFVFLVRCKNPLRIKVGTEVKSVGWYEESAVYEKLTGAVMRELFKLALISLHEHSH